MREVVRDEVSERGPASRFCLPLPSGRAAWSGAQAASRRAASGAGKWRHILFLSLEKAPGHGASFSKWRFFLSKKRLEMAPFFLSLEKAPGNGAFFEMAQFLSKRR